MEFVTVATLNEILLPPFLFIVTFCFLCCQLKRQSYTEATQNPLASALPVATPQPLDEPTAIKEIQALQETTPAIVPVASLLQTDGREVKAIEEYSTPLPQADTLTVEERENVPVEQDAGETVYSAELASSQQSELCAQVLAVIDGLGKREARKLCGPLGIQQKRNGVELSTELMVASIRREFKANPDRVKKVFGERLKPTP
jgi:hypothetical protein